MLVRTGLNDTQVAYWEPAKYVARLRTLKTDERPLLLKINLEVGHGGASGRFDSCARSPRTTSSCWSSSASRLTLRCASA